MGITALGDLLNLEKSTTSRLVKDMFAAGLCNLSSQDSDKRHKLVTLTKRGQKSVDQINKSAEKQIKDALGCLTFDEKTLVTKGLALYAHSLKKSRKKNGFTVARLCKEDVPALIAVIQEVRLEYGFKELADDGLRDIYDRYASSQNEYYVVKRGSTVVGGAGLGYLEDEICELKEMYLASQARGLGLGRDLLVKIEKRAKKTGYKQCYIETHDSLYRANSFYQKAGYTSLEKPLGSTGHYWTNRWYLKELT